MSVESALRRIAEAESEAGIRDDDRDQQFGSYEKTLRALEDVAADDEDEGVAVVTSWIVEQIQSAEARPGSRAVRRRARRFCLENGYDIGNDDWLGV